MLTFKSHYFRHFHMDIQLVYWVQHNIYLLHVLSI